MANEKLYVQEIEHEWFASVRGGRRISFGDCEESKDQAHLFAAAGMMREALEDILNLTSLNSTRPEMRRVATRAIVASRAPEEPDDG